MRYKLQMMDTDFGVGKFAAMPAVNLSFNEMIDQLRENPFDDYMHEFVLQRFKDFRTRKLKKLIVQVMKDKGASDPVLAAIMYEACICHERQHQLLPLFDGIDPTFFLDHTPAIHIRNYLLEDQALHTQWIRMFGNNIFNLTPLPRPEEHGLASPIPEDDLPKKPITTISDTFELLKKDLPAPNPRKPLTETIDFALKALEKADAFLGPAMEHKASLSPIARLRHWMPKIRCKNGRMSNSLEGIQTCYGRGLSTEQADASYSMEMAERFSSYASFGSEGVLKYARKYPLLRGSYEELTVPAINPSDLRLEVPYAGQPLHWLEGCIPDGKGGTTPMWVPAQLVFLFCNLDEQSLFSAFGSTGLASGNTQAEAKVAALTEVIERDSDATLPFSLEKCFRIKTQDPDINHLLNAYKEDGIDVWFMDATSEFGVPCYKSIVVGKRGDMNKGTGSGLNGKSALVSAMTETPYPYPGPQSAPAPSNLPIRELESLPNYSTGSAEGDLLVLENTLISNGYTPAYVDLTRKDLNIPVTRAVIPGLEFISDFDHYSRVSPRLYQNYLKL